MSSGDCPTLSRRRLLALAGGTGVAAVTATLAASPQAHAAQHLWKWCFQCSGLWFSGNSNSGYCPVGSGLLGWDHPHRSAGSGDYVLRFHDEAGAGETDWDWCSTCAALWSEGWWDKGLAVNKCPNSRWPNGIHDFSGSGVYKLEALPGLTDGPGGQAQWFVCRKCAGLFFAGNGPMGACPAGGGHEHRSGVGAEYVLRRL
jgi:hypothetical protein